MTADDSRQVLCLAVSWRHRPLISIRQLSEVEDFPMNNMELLKKTISSIPDKGVVIPIRGGSFTVQPKYSDGYLIGVNVSNLGQYPFLPIEVFSVVFCLLELSITKSARKGDAMNCRLGDPGLEINTIEGLVAKVLYGKELGDTVFRRITPISQILQWAGICKNEKGSLFLLPLQSKANHLINSD